MECTPTLLASLQFRNEGLDWTSIFGEGTVQPDRQVSPEAVRALVTGHGVDSAQRLCPVCRAQLTGRQRACSGKCRAALSRWRRAQGREARDQEIRALLEAALRKLEG